MTAPCLVSCMRRQSSSPETIDTTSYVYDPGPFSYGIGNSKARMPCCQLFMLMSTARPSPTTWWVPVMTDQVSFTQHVSAHTSCGELQSNRHGSSLRCQLCGSCFQLTTRLTPATRISSHGSWTGQLWISAKGGTVHLPGNSSVKTKVC